ncbi:uncharacterized protein LOC141651498 [Silene latifolia]|uniref:uncharacterized protein LOC141651498 n=1 Tax=Silene latifolia TaxID=37657 RepID=UPI003D780E20
MEYLTRIIQFTTETLDFKLHSLCGRLGLHHMMFADDLLLFSRGDKQSIMVLLRSFATFSASSGLQMNSQKSNIYFNGVQRAVKDQIIHMSGCSERQLPFKYLGVPIVASKLGKADCQILIEKIFKRIRSFGAKKISYADRLIMVQNYIRAPLVNWEQVCTPNSKGGLGNKHSFTWNMATVGKLAICKMRDTFQDGYDNGIWHAHHKGYSVKYGYEWLRHKEQKVGCAKLVWKRWSLPKHSFMNCLIIKQALNLRDKLFRNSVTTDRWCCICCIEPETVVHLFRQCKYTKMVLTAICYWLHISYPEGNGIVWVGRINWTTLQKSCCLAAFMAVYYGIWHQRNAAR